MKNHSSNSQITHVWRTSLIRTGTLARIRSKCRSGAWAWRLGAWSCQLGTQFAEAGPRALPAGVAGKLQRSVPMLLAPALLALGVPAVAAEATLPAPPTKPHILFIVSDDLRPTLGSYGARSGSALPALRT